MSEDLMHLEIIGTGSYVPKEIIPTGYFAGKELWQYDEKGKRIGEARRFSYEELVNLTGIKERRKSKLDEWPSDLGYVASQRALENACVSADSLVGIIVASVSERENFPSAAQKIQERLGARNVQITYDMQNACAGFPLAIIQANALSRDILGNYLVIASECLTKVNDYTDINCHLFGDGAGAAVLKPTTENRGVVEVYSKSNPFDGDILAIFRDPVANCIRMPNGKKVFTRAVGEMVESGRALKEKLGWERADLYIPHQANGRIIKSVADKINAKVITIFSEIENRDISLVYQNIEKYGNMSAATCAIALDECFRNGIIQQRISEPGSRVIITSIGASMVTSAIAVQF